MRKAFIFVLNRGFQPVFRVKIHDYTALVKTAAALREIRFYDKGEKALLRFKLEHGCIVIAEMVVCSLPKVGMRKRRYLDTVGTYTVFTGFSCPLHLLRIHFFSLPVFIVILYPFAEILSTRRREHLRRTGKNCCTAIAIIRKRRYNSKWDKDIFSSGGVYEKDNSDSFTAYVCGSSHICLQR